MQQHLSRAPAQAPAVGPCNAPCRQYQCAARLCTRLQDTVVTVTGMRMLDNSAAEIRWRLTGKLGVLPIDVAGALAGRALVGHWAAAVQAAAELF